MKRLEWDKFYLGLAVEISKMSLDPSTKVGAIIVSPSNNIVGVGHNQFPETIGNKPEHYNDRTFKYKHIIHAEKWAVGNVADLRSMINATVYTSFPACPDCIDFLADHEVARLVSPPLPVEGKPGWWLDEWKGRLLKSFEKAQIRMVDLQVVDLE